MSPTRVDFGTIVDKSANERKVQIFAKGLEEDRQLVVGEITPSFLEARLEKDSKLKVLWRLIVSVPANAPVGPFLGRISVDDNKGDKRLTLAVSGTVSGVSSLETAGAGK